MTVTDALVPVPVDLGEGVRAFLTTASRNLGAGVGEDPSRVAAARADLDRLSGTPVAFTRQVHGADVHLVLAPPEPAQESVAVADGLVTRRDDVALAVLVADCVPVLLADVEAGVVGTAHAGRRGVLAGVVPEVLRVMSTQGANPSRVRAVIGPAVCGGCYEVPEQMRDEAVAVLGPAVGARTSWGTPALDLPGAVRCQLRAAGVGAVATAGGCTVEDPTWFSHRAATGGSVAPARRAGARPVGRMVGVVRLAPERPR